MNSNIINDKMIINISPNNPINPGYTRLLVELKGEKITKCTPHLGFQHRGLEKAAQNRLFAQYSPMTEKVSPTDNFFFSQAYISAVEEILGLEVPENAQYIRVLTMELNRISSHLLWLSGFADILGFSAPVFYVFNLRNQILDIFEKITESRNSYNYYIFGGVRKEISTDTLNYISNYISNFDKEFRIIENTIVKNPILADRTKGLGVVTSEIALPYSITGVNLRANGLALDFRKEKPYLVYDKLDFTIPTAFEGDCFARFKLRINEIKVSLNLVKQCVERLLSDPSGKINLNIDQTEIKPKAGKAASWIESPKGLIMCHLITNGSEYPKRLKWRTPSFYAVQLLEKAAVGCSISDLSILYSSLNIDLTEADR